MSVILRPGPVHGDIGRARDPQQYLHRVETALVMMAVWRIENDLAARNPVVEALEPLRAFAHLRFDRGGRFDTSERQFQRDLHDPKLRPWLRDANRQDPGSASDFAGRCTAVTPAAAP